MYDKYNKFRRWKKLCVDCHQWYIATNSESRRCESCRAKQPETDRDFDPKSFKKMFRNPSGDRIR